MKKSILKIIVVLLILIIIISIPTIIYLKNKTQETKLVNVNEYDAMLYVPENAKLIESTNITATFKTISSTKTLRKKLDEILKTYDYRMCNNNDQYYDKTNNIKVKNYIIKQGFLFNTFTINFSYGGDNVEDCEKVTDYKKFKCYSEKVSFYDKERTIKYSYYNKDNELKELYMYGNFNFYVRRGRGEYGLFQDTLYQGYISVPGFISYLDYQVENNKGSKNVYDDGILYSIAEVNVLKCTTKSERVIITNQNLEYNTDYCKDEFPSYWKWENGSKIKS